MDMYLKPIVMSVFKAQNCFCRSITVLRANNWMAIRTNSSHVSKKLVSAERIRDSSEPNIWVEFHQLGLEYNPVNLSLGYPDFAGPDHVIKALETVSKSPCVLLQQYTRSSGHVRLVNILSKLYSPILGQKINPMTEVLVTVGASQAISCAVMGHVNPGDEVIIIEPYFDFYVPTVKLAGGIPVFLPLRPTKTGQTMSSGDWVLDPDELRNVFREKTKAIILNTPHNPVGKVFTRSELEMIADMARKWDTLVFTDEVYEWLTYDGNEHVRIATLPGMWDRTVTVGTVGKTFSVTGWKIGWALGPKHLIDGLNAVHQDSIYTCPTPIQEAAAMVLELETERMGTEESYLTQVARRLESKRNKMAKYLTEAGMAPVIPEGGYFMLADYSKIGSKVNFENCNNKPVDHKFCTWMLKEKKLGTIPPSSFYSPPNKHLAKNFIRVCFTKEDSTLDAAGKILQDLKNL